MCKEDKEIKSQMVRNSCPLTVCALQILDAFLGYGRH